MHSHRSASTYNIGESAETVPLSWLLRRPGLGLRPVHVGERDPDITWAHAIELDDPAPFLRGGELVLTTGLRLPRGTAGQSAYVDRLVQANAAALGLGTGLRHAQVPAGVRRACEAADLPLVDVPLPTPFIAVSQAVADRLGELRRLRLIETMDQQRALSRAAVRGGVDAVVRHGRPPARRRRLPLRPDLAGPGAGRRLAGAAGAAAGAARQRPPRGGE